MLAFSNGFLVIASDRDFLQVWRRTSDAPTTRYQLAGSLQWLTVFKDSPWKPTDPQFEDALQAIQRVDAQPEATSQEDATSGLSMSARGQFAPWAFLDSSTTGTMRLMKLHYPMLVILGADSLNSVLLVDLERGDVARKITIGPAKILGAPSDYVLPYPSERVLMNLDANEDFVVIAHHGEVIMIPLSEDHQQGVVNEEERRILIFTDRVSNTGAVCNAFETLKLAPHPRQEKPTSGMDTNLLSETDGQYKYLVYGPAAFERYTGTSV